MEIDRFRGFGWRARIGFIAPQNIIDVPIREFYRIAPEGVAMVISMLGISALTQDEMDSALGRIVDTAKVFKNRHVDVIYQAGVPYLVHKSFGYHNEVEKTVTSATGLPCISDLGSVLRALEALSVKKIAMMTPFSEEIDTKLQGCLEHAGFDIIARTSLDVKLHELSLVTMRSIYESAKETLLKAPEAEALYIPVGGWLVSDNIELIEADFGVPVVYAMQSGIWSCLRTLGIKTPIQGFGRLLTDY
jgi:maleate cis-trans isomerase